MSYDITRTPNTPGFPALFAATVNDSTTISMSVFSALAFIASEGSGTHRVVWYGAAEADGPYLPITLSSEETAFTNVPSAGVFITPPELFACHFVRGVMTGGSQQTCTIMLKG